MRVSLDWLNDFVDAKDNIEKIQEILTMSGLEVTAVNKVENDTVLDIEVTPNRPDCLSMLGIAREFASARGNALDVPDSIKGSYTKKWLSKGAAKIDVQDKKGCLRYVGCIIKDIKVTPSPKWLIDRLNAVGIRSVNNIVDVTNYVLFETGQPLHAFDFDKLQGRRIIVRKAKKGEGIVTIDGLRRDVDQNILVIADLEKPVAVAGIMGGKDTEISGETKTILLESAYFDPITVRKAQRQLSLVSESSYRFERGVDFAMVLSASLRAQELIKKVAGGRVKGTITDAGGRPVKGKELSLNLNEIERVLGIEIETKKVMEIFKRLNLSPVKKRKGKVSVKAPYYRQDLGAEIDLIEELARLYGYDKIPVKTPTFRVLKTYDEEKKAIVELQTETKDFLSSIGMNEIVTYTLTSRSSIEALGFNLDSAVRLKNPLSSNQEFMRPSLLSEMLEVISWNLNRRNGQVKLFELSKVYVRDKEKDSVREKLNLCLGVCGTTGANWKDKERLLDCFDLKGIVIEVLEFLGVKDYAIEKSDTFMYRSPMSVVVKIGNDMVGAFGEVKDGVAKQFDIKQKLYAGEIYVDDLMKHVNLKRRFLPLARYPSIKRDISLLLDDSISASSILSVIKEVGGGLVKAVEVFDLYKGQQIGEGKKSIAYSIEYRSDEKTLKDEDIIPLHKNIQEELVKRLGAQIR